MAVSFRSLAKKAPSKSSITDIYKVDRSDNPIIMNLEIGPPGQSSLSRVRLGTVALATDVAGEITNLEVGTNKSVKGRRLFVSTVVTDMQTSTDDTLIRFSIDGGPTGEKFIELTKTTEPGGSVLYEIQIFFFT